MHGTVRYKLFYHPSHSYSWLHCLSPSIILGYMNGMCFKCQTSTYLILSQTSKSLAPPGHVQMCMDSLDISSHCWSANKVEMEFLSWHPLDRTSLSAILFQFFSKLQIKVYKNPLNTWDKGLDAYNMLPFCYLAKSGRREGRHHSAKPLWIAIQFLLKCHWQIFDHLLLYLFQNVDFAVGKFVPCPAAEILVCH